MDKLNKITIFGIIFILILSAIWISTLYNIFQKSSEEEAQIKILKKEVNEATNELSVLNGKIANANDRINQVIISNNENNTQLNLLKSGKRYDKHNPTYLEVISFLSSDKTDRKPYDEETFNCANYAQEVNNNAEKQGIPCAFVSVNLSVSAHACIAFNTTDKGLIYYEPQNDYKVNLEVGKDYWADCVVCPSGYYFKRNNDFIIEDFKIIW